MAKRGDRTRHKLSEAKFFLEQLEANYGKLKKFDYFLSAFISSARSVTWVMRKEYSKVVGWERWHNSRELSNEEAALLKGTNLVRVKTEKLSPLKTDSLFSVQGIKVENSDLERLQRAMAKGKGQKVPVSLSGSAGNFRLGLEIAGERFSFPATEVLADRRLQEFPEENILKVCQRYYQTLASIVDECGKKFDA